MSNERWHRVAEMLTHAFAKLQEAKTIDNLENAARETLALLDQLDMGCLALVKSDIKGNITKITSARKLREKRDKREKREKWGKAPRKEGSAQSRSGSIVHSTPSPAVSSPLPQEGLANQRAGERCGESELGESTYDVTQSTENIGSMDSGKEVSLSPEGDEPLLISESVSASKEVATGCIWLAHTFAFIGALMKNITDPALGGKSPAELAKMAYLATLRPHHNRATAVVFELAFKTLQGRKKFIERLGIDESDERLRREIQEYSSHVDAFVDDTYKYYEANSIKA